MKKKIFIAILLTFLGTLFAAEIYVPDDYSTISAAIGAATQNDEIIVRNGTYTIYGNQTISVSGLILRSENGASSCVLDFNQNPSSFIISASSVIIDGLAFKNSTGSAIRNYGSSTTITNCIFEDNNMISQYGSAVSSYEALAELSNCIFDNNTGNSIVKIEVDYTLGYNPIVNEIISNNLFSNNTITDPYQGAHLKIHHANFNYTGELANNTFAGTSNNAIYFQPYTIIGDSSELNISNSIFFNADIVNTTHINFSYNSFSNAGYAGSSNWGDGNLVYNPPRFTAAASGDYSLQENSPCIDAGDPNGGLDSDGTRKDLGYLPIDQDLLSDTRSLKTGWNWLCFPRLKRVDYVNGSIHLPTFGLAKFLNPLWDNTVTGADPDNLEGNSSNNPDWNITGWDPADYEIYSMEGFKLEMSGDATENQVGALPHPATSMTLTNLDSRSWYIGYILPQSGLITEVIPQDLLQYQIIVKAQHWTASFNPGNGWLFDTSYVPKIKLGQMIELTVKTSSLRSYDFQWQEPVTTRDGYQDRPLPQYFQFTEQQDYLPIFLELDPSDLPQEVALYIGDECKGAAVVEQNQGVEAISQINAYLLQETEENWQEELEIVYYYGTRQANRLFSDYAVYNSQAEKYIQQNLNLRDLLGQDKVIISMRNGNFAETPETEFDFKTYNYPNPFNPTTDIYFSLPASAETSLEIYNVKGQKVKTLVNGKLDQGEHQITWDGKDSNRNAVSSGIYFYRLQSGKNVTNQKIMLMK